MIRNTKVFMGLLLGLLTIVFVLQLFILWRPGLAQPTQQFWTSTYNMVNTFTPLVTIVLLVVTFFYQNRQLKEQRIQTQLARDAADEAQKQLILKQIEDRFFTFLKIHRENGDNMTYREQKGKRVFIEVFKKFEIVYNALEVILPDLESVNIITKKLDTRQKIEIAYLLIFYGCKGDNSTRMLSGALYPFNEIVKDSKQTFSEIIIKKLMERKVTADGFQASLGHYFRHMFQTVIYIHNQPLLKPNDKKFYIKRLRAQLSNHEIAVFFINSFSLGRRWTIYHSKTQPKKTDLITEYRLIQNLPSDFFSKFDFRCFFPQITYEGGNKPFVHTIDYQKCPSNENLNAHG